MADITTENKGLAIGGTAPDFALPDDNGGTLALSDLRGKKVVLYFYPKDDTPGCTLEAQDFARLHDAFVKTGTAVVGVSKDDVKKHGKFKAKYCLPFPLVSDNAQMCEDYGVWVEKSMYGKKYMGIERTTLLIDAQGIITRIWPKVKVTGHAEEVLEAVQRL